MKLSDPIGTVKFATQTMKLADGLLRFYRQNVMYEVFKDNDGTHRVATVDLSEVLSHGDTGVPNWYDQDGNKFDFNSCFVSQVVANRKAELLNCSVEINGGRAYVGDIVFRVMKGQIKQELIYRHNGQLKAINPDAIVSRKVNGNYHYLPMFSSGLGAGVVIKTDDSELLSLGHVSKMYRTYKDAAKVAGFNPEMSSVRNGRLQGVTQYVHGGRNPLTFATIRDTIAITKRNASA